MAGRIAAAMVVAFVISACEGTVAPALEIDGITPSVGPPDRAQAVVIEGRGFTTHAIRDLETGDFTLDVTFAVALQNEGAGSIAVDDVIRVSTTRIEGVVPAGIPVGVYDLVLTSPAGQIVRRAEAYHVCHDLDGDAFCDIDDSCVDVDGDGICDTVDPDDDNDGVVDEDDAAPGDPNTCTDVDSDTCDDCAVGVDDFGPAVDQVPSNDGPDLDGDEVCDAGDDDDDDDGVLDGADSCAAGVTGWTSDAGTDHDGDGCLDSDAEDDDDDNDGVVDGSDSCSTGVTGWTSDAGADHDGDGCLDSDAEDDDDDNDGAVDGSDSCSTGVTGWTSDVGTDHDGDGCLDSDAEDDDDDNDGVADGSDSCSTGVIGWASDAGTDRDGDGCLDSDAEDDDDDNDGVLDGDDLCPTGETGWTSNGTTDADGDGCRGATEDCDDTTETGGTCYTGCSLWYGDQDGDDAGWAGDSRGACSQPSGYVSNDQDCDDRGPCKAACSPSETEALSDGNCADTWDNDCDTLIDDAEAACIGKEACTDTAWATVAEAGTTWGTPGAVVDPPVAGVTWATADWAANRNGAVSGFDIGGHGEPIKGMRVVFAFYLSSALTDDVIEISLTDGVITTLPVTIPVDALGKRVGIAAAGYLWLDVSSLVPESFRDWDLIGNSLRVDIQHRAVGVEDGATMFIDAVGVELTHVCNAAPVAVIEASAFAAPLAGSIDLSATPTVCDLSCQNQCDSCTPACPGSCDIEGLVADLRVRWECDDDGDDTTWDTTLSTTKAHACSYATAGVKHVLLEVQDGGGASTFARQALSVVSAAGTIREVTTTADTGVGSIDEAIDNLSGADDAIVFTPGLGAIVLTGSLRSIAQPVAIIGNGSIEVYGDGRGCIDVDSTGVLISGLVISGCGGEGIHLDQDGVVIEDTVIRDNNGAGIVSHATDGNVVVGPGNEIYGNNGHGIEIQGSGITPVALRGNIIYQNDAAASFGIYIDDGNDGTIIEHNIIYEQLSGVVIAKNSPAGFVRFNTFFRMGAEHLWIEESTSSGWEVRGNIFVEAGGWAINPNGATFSALDYNLYSLNVSGNCSGCSTGGNAAFMDPMFTDVSGSAREFMLVSGSPAVDAAVVVPRADGPGNLDVNGQLPGLYEGLAPDMGAIELIEP